MPKIDKNKKENKIFEKPYNNNNNNKNNKIKKNKKHNNSDNNNNRILLLSKSEQKKIQDVNEFNELKQRVFEKYPPNNYDIYCLINKDNVKLLQQIIKSFTLCNESQLDITFSKNNLKLYTNSNANISFLNSKIKMNNICEYYKYNENSIENYLNKKDETIDDKKILTLGIDSEILYSLWFSSINVKKQYYILCFKCNENEDAEVLNIINITSLNIKYKTFTIQKAVVPIINTEITYLNNLINITDDMTQVSLTKDLIISASNFFKTLCEKTSNISIKITSNDVMFYVQDGIFKVDSSYDLINFYDKNLNICNNENNNNNNDDNDGGNDDDDNSIKNQISFNYNIMQSSDLTYPYKHFSFILPLITTMKYHYFYSDPNHGSKFLLIKNKNEKFEYEFLVAGLIKD